MQDTQVQTLFEDIPLLMKQTLSRTAHLSNEAKVATPAHNYFIP
jgi:hypothetical protein